jgi:hypothetical protein
LLAKTNGVYRHIDHHDTDDRTLGGLPEVNEKSMVTTPLAKLLFSDVRDEQCVVTFPD